MFSDNLASARRCFTGAIMGLALLGTAGTANATSFDLGTVSADPTTGTFSTFYFSGQEFKVYNLYIPVTPFTISSGDDVTVHVALTSALTVPSGDQFVGLNFEPRAGSNAPSNIQVAGTMEFTGGAGGPSGPVSSGFGGLFSNVIGQTSAAWTFTDLVSFAAYTWDNGLPETFSEISVSYQVNQAVPVPAALPLFASGLGVLGFFARRRRKAAA